MYDAGQRRPGMEALSLDLRERVAAACDEGSDTQPEIAERFAVSVAFITKLLRRRRITGSGRGKPAGRGQDAGPRPARPGPRAAPGGRAAGRDAGGVVRTPPHTRRAGGR